MTCLYFERSSLFFIHCCKNEISGFVIHVNHPISFQHIELEAWDSRRRGIVGDTCHQEVSACKCHRHATPRLPVAPEQIVVANQVEWHESNISSCRKQLSQMHGTCFFVSKFESIELFGKILNELKYYTCFFHCIQTRR
jgi:hypothetical protein